MKGTSKNGVFVDLCESDFDNKIRGCGDDGAIWFFRCGQAACGDSN
jgi:hypothetical protein